MIYGILTVEPNPIVIFFIASIVTVNNYYMILQFPHFY